MKFLCRQNWFCLLLLLWVACNPQPDGESKKRQSNSDSLIIAHAWIRPAVEGSNSAAYLTLHNHTARPDTLVGISAADASGAHLHLSYEENGMMSMRPVDSLVVGAGSRIEFKPGGYHIMLTQVNRQLIAGDSLALSLQFSRSGGRRVWAVVQ